MTVLLWVAPAILSGLFDALKGVARKKNTVEFDALFVSWGWMLYATLFLALVAFFVGVPRLDYIFWIVVGARTILDAVATILIVRALRAGELSLTMPILALTPLFLFVVEAVGTGTYPTLLGFFGIFLIVGGVYALYLHNGSAHGIFAPFKNIIGMKERE